MLHGFFPCRNLEEPELHGPVYKFLLDPINVNSCTEQEGALDKNLAKRFSKSLLLNGNVLYRRKKKSNRVTENYKILLSK